MSAEAVARVMADLKRGQVRMRALERRSHEDEEVLEMALLTAREPTVVDATDVYRSLAARERPVALYEHCAAPPWDLFAVAYQNEHGNVIVTTVAALPPREERRWVSEENEVDWAEVRWILECFVWLGGRSAATGPFPTTGPVHMWRVAVNGDGSMADLRWVQLEPDLDMQRWDMANLVLLGALDFCNCANVVVTEPSRPRPEAKRIARTGVRVHTLSVLASGKTRRSIGDASTAGVPLTSVRGHFALYGPEHGRGLLFGKHSGRFWVPQHARGSEDHGAIEKDYRLTVP